MASEIRANILKNRVGLGTVSFTNTGPVVSGIVTATTFVGNVTGNVNNTGNLLFQIGGSEKARIHSSGQVGINTITPQRQLHIHDGSNTGLKITNDQSGAGGSDGLDIYIRDDNQGVEFVQRENSFLTFHTNNTERLRITSDGKIGINQNTPTADLEVCPISTAVDTATIFINAKNHDTNVASEAILKFGYGHSGNPDAVGHIKLAENGGNNFDGDLIFGLPTNNSAGGSVTNERFRIRYNGQVSISDAGNVFGNARLNIRPTNRTTAFSASDGDTWHDFVLMQGGGAQRNAVGIAFEIEDGGSYHKNAGTGICAIKNGTNSDYGCDLAFITRPQSAVAQERLRIASNGQIKQTAASGDTIFTFKRSDTNTTGAVGVLNFAASDDHSVANIQVLGDGNNEGAHIVFKTTSDAASSDPFNAATVERLRIMSSGNVGIGTDNAGAPLHIESHSAGLSIRRNGQYLELDGNFGNGSAQAISASNSLRIQTGGIGNSYEKVRITSAGLMGVGTNNPQKNLHLYTSGVATLRIETGDSRGQAWDILSTNGAQNNTGTLSFRDESGSAYLEFGANGGSPELTARLGGSNDLLRIDNNGNVTKPYNPAFIAGRTGGNQTFTVGTFPLNVARLNVGNHYSTSTYKFTAPVAGVYYFYAQVYYNNGNGHYRVGFRKEPSGGSAIMLNTAAHHMVGNDNVQSISIIESLAVGDTVRLYSDQNGSIQCYYNINDNTYGAHTYFMGYLIG